MLYRWEASPLTWLLARRAVTAGEVRERALALSERGEASIPLEWPTTKLLSWPDPQSSESGLELAISPAGHDPRRRGSWGSAVFVDDAGKTFVHGRSLRQYFIDRDGHPVLTVDGSPIHVVVDAGGDPALDEYGAPVLGPVDVPPGCEVRRSPRRG